jgi:hypothetical protein
MSDCISTKFILKCKDPNPKLLQEWVLCCVAHPSSSAEIKQSETKENRNRKTVQSTTYVQRGRIGLKKSFLGIFCFSVLILKIHFHNIKGKTPKERKRSRDVAGSKQVLVGLF